MRLLEVICSVNPAGGGVIASVVERAGVLTARGHSVEIASLDAPNSGCVRQCPVALHALGPGRGGYCYSPRLSPWLSREATRFDAVIVNGLWNYAGFGTWRGMRGSRTPYFVFPHGMLDPWFKRAYPLKHLKKWLYWPWADYRVLRDAKAVLFTCEEERRLARQSFWLYRAREIVVGLGIASPPSDAEGQKRAFLGRFPELAGKRILLFLGRIHPKKGCDLLIKAFAQLLNWSRITGHWSLGNLHLVLAGPDQVGWATELKALAANLGVADRITWPGMLSGDLKWGAIRSAEAFVLPSHQENFGIAVAEALACGTPVLISDQVNIWREIKQDGAGIVGEDTEAGTETILRLWLGMSDAARETMRRRATACFIQRFEIHQTAESVLRAIQAS